MCARKSASAHLLRRMSRPAPEPAPAPAVAVSSHGRKRRAATPCDLGDELRSQSARAPRVAEGVARRLMPLVLNQGIPRGTKRSSKYVVKLKLLVSKMKKEGTGTRTMKGADIALKALSLPLGVASRITAAFSDIASDLILMSKSPSLATASAATMALERLAGVFEAFLELRVAWSSRWDPRRPIRLRDTAPRYCLEENSIPRVLMPLCRDVLRNTAAEIERVATPMEEEDRRRRLAKRPSRAKRARPAPEPAPAAKVVVAVSSRGRERRAPTPFDSGHELRNQRAAYGQLAAVRARRKGAPRQKQ